MKLCVLAAIRNAPTEASLCPRSRLPQLKNMRLKSSSSVRTRHSFSPSS